MLQHCGQADAGIQSAYPWIPDLAMLNAWLVGNDMKRKSA